MKHLQLVSRMFFRAFVVSMIILNKYPTAYYALPLGILVTLCCEAEAMTKKD